MQRGMKKYGWLAAATAVAITGVLTAGSLMKPETVEVKTYTLEERAVEKTVSCTGKIEAAESRKVYTDISCVMQDVPVTAGQQVEKGDVLFTVDVDATKQVLATMGGVSPDTIPTDNLQHTVTAPVSGIITTLNAAEGEMSDSSKPCVVISPSDALQVKVSIHERDLRSVKVGQTVKVSGVAFAKSSYQGTVKSISPSARTQYNGSISETVVDAVVMLAPKELDDSLRLGLTAKAKVVVSSTDQARIVPYEYVLQDENDKEFVYICENGRAVKRLITVEDELASGYQVSDGLKAGDRIITNPDAVPKEGAPVSVSGKGR